LKPETRKLPAFQIVQLNSSAATNVFFSPATTTLYIPAQIAQHSLDFNVNLYSGLLLMVLGSNTHEKP